MKTLVGSTRIHGRERTQRCGLSTKIIKRKRGVFGRKGVRPNVTPVDGRPDPSRQE